MCTPDLCVFDSFKGMPYVLVVVCACVLYVARYAFCKPPIGVLHLRHLQSLVSLGAYALLVRNAFVT